MTNTITVVDSGSTSTSGQGGQSLIAGTPTPGSFIDAPLLAPGGSVGGFSIEVSGIWTGTLSFEQSQDGGVIYTAMDAVINGINTKVQSITSNGVFKGNCASDNHIRVRATAAMTGTANINIIATPPVDVSHVIIVGGGGAGDIVQVSNLPTTVDTNSGNAGASTLRSALDGTGATGVSQLAGGVGSIGWLSGIFSKLSSLVTGIVVSNLPASQPSSGYAAGASTLALKASAGTIFSIYACNRNASSPRYLQVYAANNSTAGSPALPPFLIPFGGVPLAIGTDFFTAQGIAVANGITLAVSTSAASYVAPTASDHDLGGLYL